MLVYCIIGIVIMVGTNKARLSIGTKKQTCTSTIIQSSNPTNLQLSYKLVQTSTKNKDKHEPDNH